MAKTREKLTSGQYYFEFGQAGVEFRAPPSERDLIPLLSIFEAELIISQLRVSPLWQGRPRGPILVSRVVPPQEMYGVEPNSWEVTEQLDGQALPINMKTRYAAGVAVYPAVQDSRELRGLEIFLRSVSKLLRPAGVLMLFEQNGQRSSYGRLATLKNSGYVKSSVAPLGEGYWWQARLPRQRPSRSAYLADQDSPPEWIRRGLGSIVEHYRRFGFEIENMDELNRLIRRGTAWQIIQALRECGGVVVGASDGCRWKIDTHGETTAIGSICEDHKELLTAKGSHQPKIREARGIFAEIYEFDARGTTQSPYVCPWEGCGERLAWDTQVVAVTKNGSLLSVDTVCPEHGLKEHHTLLTEGSDLSRQRIKRICDYYHEY